MYLYFGIRTINQTRQVEQFCSLQKKYENKNNYHNIQILITYLLLIIITVAALYFEIYLYFEKLVWSSKRMISILMKKVVFSPFMLYIPTWSDLQLYQPVHAWHILYTCIQVLTPKTKILTSPVKTLKFKFACDISLQCINVI